MASNSLTLKFTTAVRGVHLFRKKWKPALNEQLHCLQEPDNNYGIFNIKTCKPDKKTVDHLPREISRPTKFLLDRVAEIVAEIGISHYRRSPLIQGGSKIRCKVSATLPGTIRNHMFLYQYKEFINKLYCEPKNEVIIGNFLTSVPNENIHLNQPQQQQLAQKKVNRKKKIMRNSQLIFETISINLVHRSRRNKKQRKIKKR